LPSTFLYIISNKFNINFFILFSYYLILKTVIDYNIYNFIIHLLPKALVSGITQSPTVKFLTLLPAATTSATPSFPPTAPYSLNLGLIG